MRKLFLLAAGLLSLFAFQGLALALSPPSVLQVYSAQVVRNTIEQGDMALALHWYVDSDSYTVPASSTIMIRLYDTDNATLLDSVVPYVYFDYGYDNGISLFYFDNQTAPDWGGRYRINIAGSAAFFDPLPTPYNYYLASSEYATPTGQEENQDLMTDYVLGVAQLLEIAYPTYTLYGATDMGYVLSDTGETYFRGAMPGLHSIAPELFLTQFFVPQVATLPYTDNLSTTYEGRLADSEIMEGFAALGDEMGTTGQAVAGGIAVLCSFAFIIWTNHKGWGTEPGLLAGGLVLTCSAILLGDAVLAVRLVMGLIGGIMLMYILFFKRA